MSTQTFVIVGASMTGAHAAQELREQGFDGRVVLIGADPERPYERPPLTKDYLRGESERAGAYVHDEGYYAAHEIELRTATKVAALDLDGASVRLADGERVAYDRLLLATGARPRMPAVPGGDLDGVLHLRTLADCDALRARIETGGRVAVVGAGWIGSEFGASARQRGCDVVLIDPARLPNERIFGPEIGGFYRDVHAAHGVELALGEGVEEFLGDRAVSGVRTTSGREIECDFAVVGIGVIPSDELARAAGLTIDNGIVVDASLRTSAPDVFAAGDVARAWHPVYEQGIRVEHWANALTQGPAAARAMLGQPVSYDHIPYFFSDQYDTGMEYSGFAPTWDEVVFRGDPAGGEFMAFWLSGGLVVAGMNVNVWDVNEHVQAIIRAGAVVDLDALRDVDTPLASLVGG